MKETLLLALALLLTACATPPTSTDSENSREVQTDGPRTKPRNKGVNPRI